MGAREVGKEGAEGGEGQEEVWAVELVESVGNRGNLDTFNTAVEDLQGTPGKGKGISLKLVNITTVVPNGCASSLACPLGPRCPPPSRAPARTPARPSSPLGTFSLTLPLPLPPQSHCPASLCSPVLGLSPPHVWVSCARTVQLCPLSGSVHQGECVSVHQGGH